MVKKVVIVGAGPCGLLLAHYLLRRGDRYQIEIYDRRSDPRVAASSNARSFPISLSTRGEKALAKIDGLLEAVESQGSQMQGSALHRRKGKQKFLPFSRPLIVIDRVCLVNTLLSHLTEKYDGSKVNIHFDCQCTQVDVKTKQVKFQPQGSVAEEIAVDCDILIGADGTNSAVRKCFLNAHLFELEQKYVLDDYKRIYFPSIKNEKANIKLEADRIHSWIAKNGEPIVVVVPQPDGSCSGVLTFPRANNEIVGLTTTKQTREFFDRTFPEVSKLMPEEEVEAFLNRPISSILTIRCNRYHYDDWVLIMGDAAHGVSPSLGQGCNAAWEDVENFDNLLDIYGDNFAEALPEFTARRVADGRALWELSDTAFPPSKALFVEYLFRRSFARKMNKIFPQWFPLLPFDLVRETTLPYSQILKLNEGWVSKVKKAKGVLNI